MSDHTFDSDAYKGEADVLHIDLVNGSTARQLSFIVLSDGTIRYAVYAPPRVKEFGEATPENVKRAIEAFYEAQ